MADGIFKRLLERRSFPTRAMRKAGRATAGEKALMRLLAPHFDRRFYATHNPDVVAAKADPLLHFVRYGNAERRDPSPSFCVTTYMMRNPRVAEEGTNALLHYLQTGSKRGALVDAVDERVWLERASFEVDLQRTAFDPIFYKENNADIGELDPLYHFAKFGWLERRDPTPNFSTSGYLELNPDVAAAGVNPFFHWIAEGRREGRAIVDPRATEELDFQREVMRPHFDDDHYLSQLDEHLTGGSDALTHFAAIGWKEGKNPNKSFSVGGYLSTYDDVRQAGVNPFYHYLVEGRREGREQQPQRDYRCTIIAGLRSLDESAAASLRWARGIDMDDHQLKQAFRSRVTDGYAVTFSHDDYSSNVGGLQLCLRRESAEYSRAGISHVHLFPGHATLHVGRDRDPVWGVLLDGVLQGHVAATSILECLAALTSRRLECVAFAVHSLLGHNADLVVAAARACAAERALFWVHDYSAVCAGLRLMRNDVEWCGAPPEDSAACRVCIYKEKRSEQRSAFERLFASLPFRAIAPSQIAASLFRTHHPDVPVAVREHLRLGQVRTRERQPGAIRIAFLGHPAAHKGWYDFIQLVETFAERSDVVFLHVSSDDRKTPNVHLVRSAPDREGSTFPDAIADAAVDFAFIGSLWQETFCLTAYEAVAGGAEILTYSNSGQPAVLANQGHGHVFDSLPALIAYIDERLNRGDVRTRVSYYDLEAGLDPSSTFDCRAISHQL